jgi:mono/diheme cytochrome c family protein
MPALVAQLAVVSRRIAISWAYYALTAACTLLLMLVLAAPARAGDEAVGLVLPGQMPLGHFDQHGGEDLYRAICQGCHMPDARGAQGAAQYPALAANPRLETAAYPAAMVLAGRRAMPPLGGSLSDEQIAEVVNYVRSHFDNRYADTITPDEVERLRASLTSASKSP